ncbi:helix-turn-helix transcriptional regulator [Streptomyces sp. ME02-8801-2C]|uniref:response regulator transcription factor n=1 Tax=Streptomyces sp. ME02-8801-2C TaxID=3028680 RepID=UPI0029B9E95C|nr:helix-turn-helix transcriptional regulator [Streptomyces sp. ME02-8801-2C]MDX3456141.1 helix-turn-helix transcriptional regulator [Streptomyces sp. ME02-8801-2C]
MAELTITPDFDTSAPGIEADERRILDLLYAGLNDATIARRLGMGHRTVQRKVQRLMERLHANGRVALGAHAQKLGLLHSADAPQPTRPSRRTTDRTPTTRTAANRAAAQRAGDRNTHSRESTFPVHTSSA